MQFKGLRLLEFLIIFIIIPVSYVFTYPLFVKFIIGFLGFIYVVFVLQRVEKNKFKINPNLNWKQFWKSTLFKFSLIATLTILFVWITDKESLFTVMLNKPLMWFIILLVYSLLSVYPQELLYRLFFFQRYSVLFKNEYLLIFVNAIVFSLAHLFFRNALVIIITFLGGILFAHQGRRCGRCLRLVYHHAQGSGRER